jgi:hypothetical protein
VAGTGTPETAPIRQQESGLEMTLNSALHALAKSRDVLPMYVWCIFASFVPTKDMLADVMTKPQFEKHRAKLGLVEICDDETRSVDIS